MEIKTNQENGTDVYLLKDVCANCGSNNMAVRYVFPNQMMQQWCLDCRRYTSIPKAKNWNARVSSSLTHWANAVKERDHYVCRVCGLQSDENEAHHIISVKNIPIEKLKLKFSISNGITLCKECHKMVHLNEYVLEDK